jgi:hypothetical protein
MGKHHPKFLTGDPATTRNALYPANGKVSGSFIDGHRNPKETRMKGYDKRLKSDEQPLEGLLIRFRALCG